MRIIHASHTRYMFTTTKRYNMSRRNYNHTTREIRAMTFDAFCDAFACDARAHNARCTYDAHNDDRALHVRAFHVDRAQSHRNNTSTWCRMCQFAYDVARTNALRACNDATSHTINTLRDINAIDDNDEHVRIRAMYDNAMNDARSRRYSRARHS